MNTTQIQEQLRQRDERIAKLEADMIALKARLDTLKRRPGRPPKERAPNPFAEVS